MRSFIPAVLTLVSGVSASAQVLPNPHAMDILRYDDGVAETSWKISNPSGASDFFSVDLNGDAAGSCIVGLLANLNNNSGAPLSLLSVGLYGDNLAVDGTGATPDLSNSFGSLANPTGTPLGFCPGDTVYNIPDVVPVADAHVAVGMNPGDSGLWVCSDNDVGVGRSYFSADAYQNPATAHTTENYMLGTASKAPDNTLWLNGGLAASIDEGDEICMLFKGTFAFQAFMVFTATGGPVVPAVFFTGFGAVDDLLQTATLCTTWPCFTGFIGTLGLRAFYKNVGPGWSFSNTANLTVVNPCPPPPPPCSTWGQKDDGILDGFIWKVQNPAGSGDWFSVRHGVAVPGITSVTGMDVASWDFCGTGPSWARVGMYNADLAFDITGATPDTTAAGTIAEGINQGMGPNQSDWTYPATFYNTGPPVALAGEDVHGAIQWATLDTCVWIGSDNDGTDDSSSCSVIPSSTSHFTSDGYATPGASSTNNNWMIKLLWQ